METFHPYPSDRTRSAERPRWRRALVALSVGVGCYLLSLLLAAVPGVVEPAYGRVVGPAAAWLLSWTTALFPFPVAQLVLAVYVGWLLVLAIGGLRRTWRRRGRRLRALGRSLGRGAARLALHAGVALTSFYLLWGFHYARPSLEARMGLPDGRDADRAELVSLAEQAVRATNGAYRAIHDTGDAGAPTAIPADRGHLRDALEEGWRRAAARAGLPGHYGWSFGRAKAFVPDGFLVRVGIGGFYFPWTGEAVFDGGTPAADLVQSVAHETAHQRGVAPEDEASFLGFLAASHAPDPVARYSALLFAQRHLVAAAASGGEEELREELTAERLPGVQRDLEDLYAYLRRQIRPAVRVTRRVNDAYLKSNRVEGGVASYGLVTRLLVARSRERGGRLFPDAARTSDARSAPPQRSQPEHAGGSSPK